MVLRDTADTTWTLLLNPKLTSTNIFQEATTLNKIFIFDNHMTSDAPTDEPDGAHKLPENKDDAEKVARVGSCSPMLQLKHSTDGQMEEVECQVVCTMTH